MHGIQKIGLEDEESDGGIDYQQRSSTVRSTVSDRRLDRPDEGEELYVSTSEDEDNSPQNVPRLAMKIDVIAGPCSESTFTVSTEFDVVTLGRGQDNTLIFYDAEVSGKHAIISWVLFK